MKKDSILYLECYAGISGDMTVGALLDLGADKEKLLEALQSLPIKGYTITISRTCKAGLDVCDFCVQLDSAHENHDHDMEYLHGSKQAGIAPLEEEPGHAKHHHEQHGNHEHRGLAEILNIIEKSRITENAKKIAEKIFRIVAAAEAKAHGVPIEQVHFHEVGAVDSIVDIVAAAVCLDDLQISRVVIPFLCEGMGTVRCQHGVLPVPVPAVTNIVQQYQLPLYPVSVTGELVTPTGAAVAAAIRTEECLPESFVIQKVGIGAGKRHYERPSLLRAMLLQERKSPFSVPALHDNMQQEQDVIYKLETNIDDCTGETLGYVLGKLGEAGAKDAYYTPVYMKKNRPAYQLTVLCSQQDVGRLKQILFRETTTIGVRCARMERTVLERSREMIETKFGMLQGKKCVLPGGEVRIYPEYESIAQAAKKEGVPLYEVLEAFFGSVSL